MQRSKSKAKEITIVMMLVVIVIFSVLTVELKIRESCKTELQYPVYKRLFLGPGVPCTEAYKVCMTNGPLFPVMAD